MPGIAQGVIDSINNEKDGVYTLNMVKAEKGLKGL